jgi:hypothetical protein
VRYFDILKLLMFPACMFSIDSFWPVGLEGLVGGFGYVIIFLFYYNSVYI